MAKASSDLPKYNKYKELLKFLHIITTSLNAFYFFLINLAKKSGTLLHVLSLLAIVLVPPPFGLMAGIEFSPFRLRSALSSACKSLLVMILSLSILLGKKDNIEIGASIVHLSNAP